LVSDTAALTVTLALNSIAVTPAIATIPKGLTQQYTATGTYSDASTADITSSVTWASSATAVATIDSVGLATGVGDGSTNITAALDSNGADSAINHSNAEYCHDRSRCEAAVHGYGDILRC
jgi:hypothetical protein